MSQRYITVSLKVKKSRQALNLDLNSLKKMKADGVLIVLKKKDNFSSLVYGLYSEDLEEIILRLRREFNLRPEKPSYVM
jgi:hypothetical protein